MKKFIALQVAKPCHENWDNMQPTDKGKFCLSCNKAVIDFTNMTDNQLIAYFKEQPANTCGRFYADQLEHPLEIPTKKISWLRYFFSISIPAMLLTIKADAQKVLKGAHAALAVSEQNQPQVPRIQFQKIIQGIVKNDVGNPISFASIIIKGTTTGTSTDENGCFRLTVTDKDQYLKISALGYEEKEIPITDQMKNLCLKKASENNLTLPPVVVTASLSRKVMGYSTGVIVVKSSRSIKRREIAPLLTIVDSIAPGITFFPNPVAATGTLYMKFRKEISNDQQVIIFSEGGAIVQQETIHISSPAKNSSIQLQLHSIGYYFIQITDIKTGKSKRGKFLVQ